MGLTLGHRPWQTDILRGDLRHQMSRWIMTAVRLCAAKSLHVTHATPEFLQERFPLDEPARKNAQITRNQTMATRQEGLRSAQGEERMLREGQLCQAKRQ